MHIKAKPRRAELSLFQGHRIEAFYGADHVRPFPNKNELECFDDNQYRKVKVTARKGRAM